MLKIGYRPPTFRSARVELPIENVLLAESLGYHSFWAGEAYGADVFSPLAFLAAHTKRIKLGTSIAQIDARTPAATAMHAMTIDSLAGGGRVILGLGVSGPQIVEGWYGQPWASPMQKLSEYVSIVRSVFRREGPVEHSGKFYPLPYHGPGSVHEGRA